MSARLRGESVECPSCGGRVGVTQWDRLAMHNALSGERCAGSGQKVSA